MDEQRQVTAQVSLLSAASRTLPSEALEALRHSKGHLDRNRLLSAIVANENHFDRVVDTIRRLYPKIVRLETLRYRREQMHSFREAERARRQNGQTAGHVWREWRDDAGGYLQVDDADHAEACLARARTRGFTIGRASWADDHRITASKPVALGKPTDRTRATVQSIAPRRQETRAARPEVKSVSLALSARYASRLRGEGLRGLGRR